MPPPQPGLEDAYRRELARRYEIIFNRLYTITNMPISRFLDDWCGRAATRNTWTKLIAAYNPAAAAGVMCRTTLSVGWDGQLYDCDFNQMLDLGLSARLAATHPRLRSGRLGRSPHRHRAALLRLHGGQRVGLSGGHRLFLSESTQILLSICVASMFSCNAVQ